MAIAYTVAFLKVVASGSNVPIRRSERPPRHLRAPAPVPAAVFLRHPLSHWPNTPFKCSGVVPRGCGWGKFAGPPRTLTTEWRVLFGAMVRRPRAEAREKLRLSPPGTRGQCGPDSTRSKPSSLTWLPLLAVPNQAAVEGGWPTRGRCISLVGGCPNSFPDRARTTVLVTCPVACNPLVTPGSVANGGWELTFFSARAPYIGCEVVFWVIFY